MIDVEFLTVGPFQSNCYIVSCTETREAVIFDAGDEAARILDTVRSLGVRVQLIVNTHAHIDHVSALPEVAEELGVPVLMHRNEVPIYEIVPAQAAMFGVEAPGQVAIDRYVEDGDELRFGSVRGEFLLTPGHSPGSVCIHFAAASPPRLIAGDVLFRGSIGRTDLPGGDYDTIMRTLATRFIPLPGETVVYPGHGPATTIGEEKRTNPFLAPLARM
jgi:glyoxylase-like metal-dependent hydrolase (beta-lactamase superfamily II)